MPRHEDGPARDEPQHPDTPVRQFIREQDWYRGSPWLALVRRCNDAARALYDHVVRGDEPPPDAWTRSGLWRTGDLDGVRYWVDVRDRVTHETVVSRLLDSFGRTPPHRTRLWIIGPAGSGKTTVLYETYFRYLEERARGGAAAAGPEPMLIQPRNLEGDQIQLLNDKRTPFLRRIAGAWLKNRGLWARPEELDALVASFGECLGTGRLMPVLDGFDELNRMQVQVDLTDELFGRALHFLCASRPESYSAHGREGVIELASEWPLATVRRYLERRLGANQGAVGDAVRELLDHVERSHHGGWLRNPRYVNLLLEHFLAANYPLRDARALREEARRGEYALLCALLNGAVERVRRGVESRDGPPPADFDAELKRRLARVAEEQLRAGACTVPAAQVADDAHWQALEWASELLTVSRTDDAYRYQLTNFTLVDFFLTRPIVDRLRDETTTLELRPLWSTSLLHFVAVALRGAAPDASGLVWNALEYRTPRLDAPPAAGVGFRTAPRGAAKSFQAVNLLHLAVRLALDELGPAAAAPADGAGEGAVAEGEDQRDRVAVDGRDLRDLDLEDAHLRRLTFNRCAFDGSVLAGADVEHARFLARCSFRGANLQDVNAVQATFDDCEFDFDAACAAPDAHAPSAVRGMTVQGAKFSPDPEGTLRRFTQCGARAVRSRYTGRFARSFMKSQSEWLAGLDAAEREYVGEIRSFLAANAGREHVTVVDLMAGQSNDRLLALLAPRGDGAAEFPNVRVLAVDRETESLSDVVLRLGERFQVWRHTIAGPMDLATRLRHSFRDAPADAADLVIGKKALHELPADHQRTLLAECAQALRPGGALIVFADAPVEMTPEGRQRLAELAAPLRAGVESLARLRARYVDELRFAGDRDDPAVFQNLWVLLKDWANGNEHELRHRYFSSVAEIAGWASEAGLVHRKTSVQHRPCVYARRYNEIGFNEVARYLEQNEGRVDPGASASLIQMLAGGERHALFYRFNDHHLWDADANAPTRPLGVAVGANRAPVNFRADFPGLAKFPLPEPYRQAVGFALSVHVLRFEKPA